jgi:hypothetical protein
MRSREKRRRVRVRSAADLMLLLFAEVLPRWRLL